MNGLPWGYIIIGVLLLSCCLGPMLFMKKNGGDLPKTQKDDGTVDSDPKPRM